jgi:hypothetical protein
MLYKSNIKFRKKDNMKFEPIGAVLFTMALTSAVAADPVEGWRLVGMALGGGSIAGAVSIIIGMEKHANARKMGLWAYVASAGGIMLALAFAPEIAGAHFDFGSAGTFTLPSQAPVALVLAIGGGPIVEWLARGALLNAVKRWQSSKDGVEK